MATHSRVLAWRIPGTAEPGGLPSMGSHRVGHDLSDLAAAVACHEGDNLTTELSSHFSIVWPLNEVCVALITLWFHFLAAGTRKGE